MLLTATTLHGEQLTLSQVVSLTLRRETAAPADELKAVLAVPAALPPLTRLTATGDGTVCFCGIVDEQHTRLTARGLRVELVCRSLEALLLDNEAKPETLLAPTQERLSSSLLAPLGLAFAGHELAPIPGTLAIEKGMSCWAVLASVVQAQHGTTPWVDESGLVHCTAPTPTDHPLSGVREAVLSILPYKRLSEVWQQSTRLQYDTRWQNEHTGVQRRRYLSLQQGKNPKTMLNDSLRESTRLVITCKGACLPQKGDTVTVTVPGMGEFSHRPVQAVTYRRTAAGEETEYQLELPVKED